MRDSMIIRRRILSCYQVALFPGTQSVSLRQSLPRAFVPSVSLCNYCTKEKLSILRSVVSSIGCHRQIHVKKYIRPVDYYYCELFCSCTASTKTYELKVPRLKAVVSFESYDDHSFPSIFSLALSFCLMFEEIKNPENAYTQQPWPNPYPRNGTRGHSVVSQSC